MYQVHIADGIQYVRKAVNFAATEPPSNGSRLASHVEGKGISKVDIVIIDVDSADSR